MKWHKWLHEHSLKLLAIRDTPEAIAGGVAIGVFFGFVPLFGLKTALALFFAWLSRSNIVATILAATGHEIFFLIMPLIYRWQYDIGFWLLSNPHHWPVSMVRVTWTPHEWWTWHTLETIGVPLLLGSVVFSAPAALICFFITHAIVSRHQKKNARKTATQQHEKN
jgi:uncharacterized protein (TIGR03546 family)